jgi:hypothetical protein
MSSNDKLLGNHSAIWSFDGNNQKWIKNPEVLYPGRGYYINIIDGSSVVKFSGVSFDTDLGSVATYDKKWYFVGASSSITDIDYSKYYILKYVDNEFIKNPSIIKSSEVFWIYRL